MQSVPTLILKDPIFIQHDPGPSHPESPHRLETIYSGVTALLESEGYGGEYRIIAPRDATMEELSWNHHPDYIQRIARTSGIDHYQLDPDTATSARSWEAAIKAAGGVFSLIDRLMDGQGRNGFALVRPPGHHAERDRAMGFCLFNNVALGAHYAMKIYGLKKVVIIDWDLHHGNGTQHSFYSSDSVLYFSTHQFPYYPGTGALNEVGQGDGTGFTVNVPLGAGKDDSDYSAIFSQLVRPVVHEFKPDIILVSAGFDIYHRDPLGGMAVSGRGFGLLAAHVLKMARECCSGRVIFCLEGGYNLAGLRDGVLEVLKACRYSREKMDKILDRARTAEKSFRELDSAISFHSRYWPVA